ncbi:MAG: putative baseplate assembly protein [Halobacteriales archaeon]|nr:putative baseplate assembly protein [Halobacteriales archaeon]
MVEDPDIDGRRRETFAEYARSIAPGYTDEWDPTADGVGATMVELFADMAEDVAERLDQVPAKHQIAFFDTVGFDRKPPQAATLPIAVRIADDIGQNVRIPAGTQATAPATDARPEQVFELQSTFEATPANLEAVYSVDPKTDLIVDHTDQLTGGTAATPFSTLPNDQENHQRHALYIGDTKRLNLGPDSTLRIELETDAESDTIEQTLTWEYFGKKPDDDNAAWHQFTDPAVERLDPSGGRHGAILHGIDRFVTDRGDELRDVIRSGDSNRQVALANELLTTVGMGPRTEAEFRALEISHIDAVNYDERIDAPAVDEFAKRGRTTIDAQKEFRSDRRTSDAALKAFFGRVIEELSGERLEIPAGGGPISELPDGEEASRLVVTVTTDGELTETTRAGIKSRWVRVRVPDGAIGPAIFGIQIGSDRPTDTTTRSATGPVRIGSEAKQSAPQTLLANDVPLPTDVTGNQTNNDDTESSDQQSTTNKDDAMSASASSESDGKEQIYPFGEWPRLQDTFYISAKDTFTKAETTAKLQFERAPSDEDGPTEQETTETNGDNEKDDKNGTDQGEETDRPQLSWEYFNGAGWTRLPITADGTDRLRSDGEIRFTVPNDLQPTTVAGHDGHWIRARLVGGGYGQLVAEKQSVGDSEQWTTRREFDPPAYDRITISYTDQADPAHLLTENALEYGPDLVATGQATFQPFQRLRDDGQTLYLGFDTPLDNGPINVLFVPEDLEYRDTFHPRIRWERCVAPDSDQWAQLDTTDGTEGLTERGIVGLGFPQPTERSRRFGQELHWVRARVTRDRFEHESKDTTEQDEATSTGSFPPPCEDTVETVPPSGPPRRHMPTIEELVVNVGWANNEQTIQDEVLGSSDASTDQTFGVSTPPIADVTVWVDEQGTLTADRRAAIAETTPDRIEIEGPNEDPDAIWIRWSEQSDLLDSAGDDRHYAVDAVAGQIRFGDGTRGRIPPPGTENIRASYTTGGGVEGNVERHAIGGFRRSIQFVESVTNPIAGDGGADAETNAAVAERAPKTLRDRHRAVTAADVERIASSASRKLERVRCLPGMDQAGEETPGWVTLLIVPGGPTKRPTPSVTLKKQVEAAVLERAPYMLDATDQLVVRGPGYVPVAVETTLVAGGTESVAAIEDTARQALNAFLHPLTGNTNDTGWAFGTVPCPSDFYTVLEGIDGVDHVSDLVVRLDGHESVYEIREGDPMPSVAPDALVYSGDHRIVGRLDAANRPAGGE